MSLSLMRPLFFIQRQIPDFNFSTVGELILYKIDSLDASVRTTLNLCSVLGPEFELAEIISLYQNWLHLNDHRKEHRTKLILESLNAAVNERIIEEVYEGGQLDEAEIPDEDILYEADTLDEFESENKQDRLCMIGNISYRFRHDIWRESILKLMLDSHKRDLHRIIAESLDSDMLINGGNDNDYYSMIKLFSHRKASGNISKTFSLALVIGRSFINTCMSAQALKIFDEAIDMLRTEVDAESNKMFESLIGGKKMKLLVTSGCSLFEERKLSHSFNLTISTDVGMHQAFLRLS